MEDTKVTIDFINFKNTIKDLKQGNYFLEKDDPDNNLYLYINKKYIINVKTGEDFDFEDFDEYGEIKILKKVKIIIEE
uniref:Uncharacterized protein n=1 Tax=Siphoviridae sp. ctuUw41 TaxID=2826503 RepID=A0A8S5MZC4_9CAUD|nr:MAG TPA: hypothetical protein [Siphoviridae sp. ctuUw41]